MTHSFSHGQRRMAKMLPFTRFTLRLALWFAIGGTVFGAGLRLIAEASENTATFADPAFWVTLAAIAAAFIGTSLFPSCVTSNDEWRVRYVLMVVGMLTFVGTVGTALGYYVKQALPSIPADAWTTVGYATVGLIGAALATATVLVLVGAWLNTKTDSKTPGGS